MTTGSGSVEVLLAQAAVMTAQAQVLLSQAQVLVALALSTPPCPRRPRRRRRRCTASSASSSDSGKCEVFDIASKEDVSASFEASTMLLTLGFDDLSVIHCFDGFSADDDLSVIAAEASEESYLRAEELTDEEVRNDIAVDVFSLSTILAPDVSSDIESTSIEEGGPRRFIGLVFWLDNDHTVAIKELYSRLGIWPDSEEGRFTAARTAAWPRTISQALLDAQAFIASGRRF